MKYNLLGKTGLKVSELCFGALPIGPLQSDVEPAKAGKLIRASLEAGVNFIDTAQMYRTYPHIRAALQGYSGEVIINSKSTAASYADMEKAIHEALQELQRDYIDIFILHAARVPADVFEVRSGAWQCLKDYKQKGYLRAIGIATHVVPTVKVAAQREDVEVIFPLINYKGMGIIDGNLEDMLGAIKQAHEADKGMYAMKALAGGALLDSYQEALAYIRSLPYFASTALGLTQDHELATALKVFNDQPLTAEDLKSLKVSKALCIMPFCNGCGRCVKDCPNQALSMSEAGKPVVDTDSCVLCAYCTPGCPQFAIRLRNLD